MKNDLISKQEVLEDLSEPFAMSQCMTVEECEAMNRARKLCLARVENIEPAQQWVPVTEKLPDDAGTYIICDCYGNVMSRHFCKKADGFAGYWHANGSKYYGNPTHWMPLPEPPKEEP